MVEFALITSFDWDAGNEQKNEKHGVARNEAEQIFFNQPLLVVDDVRHSQKEIRFHALGRTDMGRLLHITFTVRADGTKLRVISARDMHRKERMIYAEA